MTKILLCEDDTNLGVLLREYLMAKNYEVDLFPDGELGLQAFNEKEYDICIFDVMMPNKDGFSLASDIRKKDVKIPIIFLTVKTLKQDVLEGFKIGADDYITKPFSMEELLYRIEAILRRVNSQRYQMTMTEYEFGAFSFDYQKQSLTINNEHIKLTTKETEMLRLLLQHANQVLERNNALKAIWGEVTYFNARSMDVYITKLRKILQADPNIEIVNIHGKGYKLVVPKDKTTL
ncbi:MAG: DNA-binding response regulator [Bacteroidales bacterium]|nr:MAG: DNA-binding response regulator [Bacteroidales bacterium]